MVVPWLENTLQSIMANNTLAKNMGILLEPLLEANLTEKQERKVRNRSIVENRTLKTSSKNALKTCFYETEALLQCCKRSITFFSLLLNNTQKNEKKNEVFQ